MRFGLFGTGPWAQLAHAPALADHPDVEFVGVWGRDPDKAGTLAAEHGVRAYANLEDLIGDVDAVAIALPPDVQAPIALRAARAGRHLLLDKPVAFTPAEADEIAAAVDERNLASAVFFTRRLEPVTADFLAEARALGGWREARVDHLGSIFTTGSPFGESPWRQQRGGLWDVGPHALALLLPVLGPVTAVTAMAGPHDMTHALLRHEGGAISTLTLSVDAAADQVRQEVIFAGEAGLRRLPDTEWRPGHALGLAISQLIAAAGGGPKPDIDVRFGAAVTAVLAACQEAIDTGRTVAVGS
ncbi:Gfo/Idh/MocA family oxidoreductase [Actinoplanes sp. KI2]|uniref:Gfo/Idh/MocA family protein n=1 Tax=Actinoplanes sp. KI2 TaxID=2983315 RepID=UPI0021D59C9C|nr:Gfo/Idh/MocA family oxidoreductase [Actinoplanes sp. KI2]MCU7724538.1 Gfo/Idh/MocA family oxidoreductase [Actinoplanes sp. KI2]